MRINGLGTLVYLAQKSNAVYEAFQLYQATQSQEALVNVCAKLSELAAGAAIGFLFDRAVGGFQATGLDRVFDSMGEGFPDRDAPLYRDFMRDQKVMRDIAGFTGGKMSDAFISSLNDYISKHRSLDGLFDLLTGKGPDALLNDLYNLARPTIGRDPLVLDLDGDGIEAIGINSANPILFDHNADTVKTATGWIKADDGILVMDRNGNGTIDSGRELFGDNTLLTTGAYAGLHAANGFQALADLDTNADKKIDSADAAYSQLRIWQDANQDGISQAGELKTLTQLGIASISTVGVASNINLGNGNTQPLSATFTRTNGQTGTAGTTVLTDGQSGSLILASNNFYREFTDNPVVTTAAGALPQMQGSGWVRDLREAMSLGTPAASALQTQVEAFAAATTRDAQMAVLEDLLVSWADTTGSRMLSIGKYSFVPGEGGMTTANYSYNANGFALLLLPQDMGHIETSPSGAQTLHLTSAGVQVLYKVNVLEVFNGTKFITAPPMAARMPEGSTTPGSGRMSGEGRMRRQCQVWHPKCKLRNKMGSKMIAT